MKDLFKLAAMWTAVVVFIVLLFSLVATGGRLGSLWSNTYFAPKEEALRREVVEQSKAYRDGVVQDLRLLQVDYLKADPSVQPALAAAIRHRATGLDEADMPADVAAFLRSLP